ncbi:MAG: FAD-dependent monooxygenase [Pseudolysinimonas sp.]
MANVGVIGAGIGGLTFAAAMRRIAPDSRVELFERDGSAFQRAQGYAIGIKGDAGLSVLRDLDLDQALIAQGAIKVGSFDFTDQRGRTLLSLPSSSEDRYTTYRVQRNALKSVLLGEVDPGTIQFGHELVSVENADDHVTCSFADGSRRTFDYLVAADGVNSIARQTFRGDDPRYLGLTAIYGDAAVPATHPLLAGGYFMTLGDNGASFFAYPQPGGTVHFSYTMPTEEAETYSTQPSAELVEHLRAETADWHELVRSIAAAADSATIGVRRYFDREPLPTVRYGRVWLIGDAAHPMAPFQGQGANTGMLDAARLAEWFAALDHDPTASEVLAGVIDKEIVGRGRKAVTESRDAAARYHVKSHVRQAFRNNSFRIGNFFIRLFNRN